MSDSAIGHFAVPVEAREPGQVHMQLAIAEDLTHGIEVTLEQLARRLETVTRHGAPALTGATVTSDGNVNASGPSDLAARLIEHGTVLERIRSRIADQIDSLDV